MDLGVAIHQLYFQNQNNQMKAYIISSKVISPQKSFHAGFSWNNVSPPARYMSAIEPNYKDYYPSMKLRRMSRIAKMGLLSATECLKESGIENPGAIITATGWGCLEDTFKFLDQIMDKKEQTLSPSTFIQSTHNTVGGQIALTLGCQEYNSVYVNHTSSFEHSLVDAIMLLNENTKNVLVGGIDELTEFDFKIKERVGYWKTENEISFLPDSTTKGTIAGEGSVFFLLDSETKNTCFSQIRAAWVESGATAKDVLNRLLSEKDLQISDIQLSITGINGDSKRNKIYKDFLTENLNGSLNCYYKHLCGQYDTSSSFALWLANEIMKEQTVPDSIKINRTDKLTGNIENILIYHYSEPNDHAFILVSKADL